MPIRTLFRMGLGLSSPWQFGSPVLSEMGPMKSPSSVGSRSPASIPGRSKPSEENGQCTCMSDSRLTTTVYQISPRPAPFGRMWVWVCVCVCVSVVVVGELSIFYIISFRMTWPERMGVKKGFFTSIWVGFLEHIFFFFFFWGGEEGG